MKYPFYDSYYNSGVDKLVLSTSNDIEKGLTKDPLSTPINIIYDYRIYL